MKKYKNYILAFIIPLTILILILLLNGYYPFGNKLLLMLDGYNQYPGFLNNFKEVLLNHETIFYSFKGITGFNLYASHIYYSFNITNLLFLLFKTSHITLFYTLIIIIKMALCSVTMLTFLNYQQKNKYNILFSICYGLTTYNLLYYLNYMWFDSIIIFPLVILGLEKILKENNYLYYTICLSLSIISNFYIGYMICIFSLLYYLYKWRLNKINYKKFLKFILYSLISGLLCSFVILPIILELLNGKGALFTETEYLKFDLDAISTFYKLTIGSLLNGDLEYGTPNVYVSMFVYINTIMYFLNKNIKLKERIISFILLLFFLISVSFNLIDYFWQMLQMPIFYPVRYAFIFDFYLIYLAYRNYNNLEEKTLLKNIIIALIIIVLSGIGFITAGNLQDPINIPAKLIYFGISILFLIYYLFMINHKSFRNYLIYLIIIELFVNAFLTLRNNGNINDINTFNTTYKINYSILNQIPKKDLERIIIEESTIKNNGLLLNYNTINYFSSVRNAKTFNTLTDLFNILVIDKCNANYYYNNPITNALLNLKYYITKDELNYYNLIDTYNEYHIYQNNDTSSIGFTINKDFINYKLENDYLTNINNLIKIINQNDKNILKEIDPIDKTLNCSEFTCISMGNEPYIKYEYKANKEELLFIQNNNLTGKDESIYELKINDKISNNINHPFKINKNDKIELTIYPNKKYKDYLYHFYIINYQEYQSLINNIQKEKLVITNYYNDAHFKGSITLDKDAYLFTSISNDNGWKVLVDNKEVNTNSIIDGLINIELTKGTHIIEFKYYPPGLKEGLIITSISLITLCSLIYLKKRKVS